MASVESMITTIIENEELTKKDKIELLEMDLELIENRIEFYIYQKKLLQEAIKTLKGDN